MAAVGVGVHGYGLPREEEVWYVGSHGTDGGPHFVTWYDWHFHHGVAAYESIQVGPAEAYIVYFQHHLATFWLGHRKVCETHLTGSCYLYCFHRVFVSQTFFQLLLASSWKFPFKRTSNTTV